MHAPEPTATPSWDLVEICVAGPPVVHEMLDGEAIVIHLESGCYYSLRDFAGQLWELLAEPRRLADMVERLAQGNDAPREAIRYAVLHLMRGLLNEHLVVVRGPIPSAPITVPPAPAELPDRLRDSCIIQRFDDVAELLKLDPVHEVDDVGWPVKAGP